jgi:hypothetical protein
MHRDALTMRSNFSGKQINSLRNVSGRFFSVFSGKPHGFCTCCCAGAATDFNVRALPGFSPRAVKCIAASGFLLRLFVFPFLRLLASCLSGIAALARPTPSGNKGTWLKHKPDVTLICSAAVITRRQPNNLSGFWPRPRFNRPLACTNARSVRAQTLDVAHAYLC